MSKNKMPIFRKKTSPWYDGPAAMTFVLLFLMFICYFGLVGMGIALEMPDSADFIFTPLSLIFFALAAGYLIIARLIKRIIDSRHRGL